MKRKASLLVGGLLVAGSMAIAAPASAQIPVCAGTANTVVLCVDPTGTTLIDDCIYAGPPPCRPVSVPGPTVTCGGRYGVLICSAITLPPLS